MKGTRVGRIGGVAGLLYVATHIPAYVVGTPDTPGPGSDLAAYFADVKTFVLANGTLLLLTVFFFLWFLGALHGLLRRAEGEPAAWSSTAFAGGLLFLAVVSVGYSAEILFPAASARFDTVELGEGVGEVSLTFATWLYHFCQVGTAAMVAATSVVALRSGVLPRWFAWLGFPVAIAALLHILAPLITALIGLVWVALVSLFMIGGTFERGEAAAGPERIPA